MRFCFGASLDRKDSRDYHVGPQRDQMWLTNLLKIKQLYFKLKDNIYLFVENSLNNNVTVLKVFEQTTLKCFVK